MRARRAWVLGAAVILLSVAAGARADEKLDPERPSGVLPLAMDKLDSYTTGMLISYIEQVQGATDAEAQANAAKVASFLSQTDPNWRVSASNAMSAARATAVKTRMRLKKVDGATAAATPTPTPTATPPNRAARTVTAAAATPTAVPSTEVNTPTPTVVPTSGGSSVAVDEEPPAATTPPVSTPAAPRSDWYNVAQAQMQEFWEADRDMPGAAPKGKIYDPRTGLLVSLDDHQRSVGMANAFSDELANTTSGAGAGTLKRIKDK